MASLAVVYFAAARLGLMVASVHGNVSPVWPATGVAVGSLLVFGTRLWPGIALGAFAANAMTPIPLMAAAGIGLGNTLEALIAVGLMRRFNGGSGWPGNSSAPSALIGASFLAPIISASLGVVSLGLSGTVAMSLLGTIWWTWWVGDALGALVVAPILVSLAELRRPSRRFESLDFLKVGSVFLGTAVVCTLVFLRPQGAGYLFAIFPLLLIAVAWFGALGVRLAGLFIAAASIGAAVTGSGPFTGGTLNQDLLRLQLFLFSVAIAGLVLPTIRSAGSLVVPGAVLLLGWAFSGWLFSSLLTDRLEADRANLLTRIRDAENAIQQRMTVYTDALRGAASLFSASTDVTRGEWRAYVESLRLAERYPGIRGMGMIAPVAEADLDRFLSQVRAGGAPDFSVHSVPNAIPPKVRPTSGDHYIITYIEPYEPNWQAQGLDITSEHHRQNAAEAARDTGEPQMTERIALVQDHGQGAGFLLFFPVYRKGAALTTVAERQNALAGWVYAPFVTKQFLHGVLPDHDNDLQLHLFEGSTTHPLNLLVATSTNSNRLNEFEYVSTMTLGGQTFTLGWNRSLSMPGPDVSGALWAGTSSALVSLLLASLVMNFQTTSRRAGAMAAARTAELQSTNARLQAEIRERQRTQAELSEAKDSADVANRELAAANLHLKSAIGRANQLAQAAEHASQAKSDFLATISHEIRTPMNGVLGFTNLLLETSLSEQQTDWVQTIQSSGETLLTLINDVLDFSKIEAGMLVLEVLDFSAATAARDVLRMLSSKAAEKGLALDLECDPGLPPLVQGDSSRFKQVLLNLIGNATKFTSQGGVRVSLGWEPKSEGQGSLQASVRDTGIGVPPDKQPLLFQKFTQADSSTRRKFGGTGLGLAICKRLVESQGGTIGMESEPGAGSTFWFALPLPVAAAYRDRGPLVSPMSVEKLGPTAGGGEKGVAHSRRILLAEDTLVNQKLVVHLLKKFGCAVDVANDGREAVQKATETAYDLILMDCQMPDMDGYEASAEIRRLQEGQPRVPIIALTANAMQGDREKCLAAGMDDYLTKPLHHTGLRRALEQWLKIDLAAAA